jgi:hypothetical protein
MSALRPLSGGTPDIEPTSKRTDSDPSAMLANIPVALAKAGFEGWIEWRVATTSVDLGQSLT